MIFLKFLLWFLVGAGVTYATWFVCDKVSWYRAKYEEAKHGVVVIAEHTRMLREVLLNSNASNKKDLDDIFSSIQLENARIAWTLGGIKLVDKISRVKPTPIYSSSDTRPTTKE